MTLHGDRELAIRLLSQVKIQNPTGKTVDWYFEKLIYDLERDAPKGLAVLAARSR